MSNVNDMNMNSSGNHKSNRNEDYTLKKKTPSPKSVIYVEDASDEEDSYDFVDAASQKNYYQKNPNSVPPSPTSVMTVELHRPFQSTTMKAKEEQEELHLTEKQFLQCIILAEEASKKGHVRFSTKETIKFLDKVEIPREKMHYL